jgi:hypothetical protein
VWSSPTPGASFSHLMLTDSEALSTSMERAWMLAGISAAEKSRWLDDSWTHDGHWQESRKRMEENSRVFPSTVIGVRDDFLFCVAG